MIRKLLGAFAGVSVPHLAVAAGAIALVAGGLGAAAGWTLNGWRLGAELATLEGDKRVCDGKLEAIGATLATQNNAIDGWRRAAEAAKGKGADARRQADEFVARVRPELERLEAAIAAQAAGGAARSCAEAAAEVRKGLRP